MTNAASKTVSTFDRAIKSDPRDLTDGELLDALVRREDRAWAELVRRYDKMLRAMVKRRISRALCDVLPSDAAEDVMGTFYLKLVEHDMRKLRIWGDGPRKATLRTWLTMLASQVAVDHVRSAYTRSRVPRKLRENPDTDPNRGGAWLGEELGAGENVVTDENELSKRRRRTKTVEDELRELRAQHRQVPSS